MEFRFRRHFRLRPKMKNAFGRPLLYVTKRFWSWDAKSWSWSWTLGLVLVLVLVLKEFYSLGLGLEIKVLVLKRVLITSLHPTLLENYGCYWTFPVRLFLTRCCLRQAHWGRANSVNSEGLCLESVELNSKVVHGHKDYVSASGVYQVRCQGVDRVAKSTPSPLRKKISGKTTYSIYNIHIAH